VSADDALQQFGAVVLRFENTTTCGRAPNARARCTAHAGRAPLS
jgi:hypothetical protein